jgi:formylglycine-generating enzyme required for sulfatase activity
MNAKRSRTALTSGGLEPVLDRGGGAHSVFAGALLAALAENPGLMFGAELFDRVKGVVVANADQTPEYADIRYTGHEKGDFLFVPRGVKFEAAGRQPAAPDREALFWQSIQASRDPADFAAYLEAFPDGTFAPLARRRIAAAAPADLALAAAPQRPPPGPPPSKPGQSFRDCADCPEMVVIPAGRFTMGSPADEAGRDGAEAPRHLVTIGRAFALGRTEVTFAEWDACAQAGGCGHRPDDAGWGRGRRPVLDVSWDDARDYVTWLSRRTGARYRLPSESEWEYAARAGTETARFWGEAADRACSFANVHDRTSKSENGYDWTHHACDDGHATTAPVGSFDANGFGLHDVLGNLWEWTQDCWNRDYSGAPADQAARDSGDCGSRVVRGGPWSLAPWDVRSATRRKVGAIVRNTVIGFRVARQL